MKPRLSPPCIELLCGLALALGSTTHAATFTGDAPNEGSGVNWSDHRNWADGILPTTGSDLVVNLTNPTLNRNAKTYDLDPNIVYNSITLESQIIFSGSAIRLGGNLVVTPTGGNKQFNNDLILTNHIEVSVLQASGVLTFYGNNISGAYGITQNGLGSVSYRGEKTFSGGFTLESGIAGAAGSGTTHFGTGQVTINGGRLNLRGSSSTLYRLNGSGGVIENDVGDNTTRTITLDTDHLAGDTWHGTFRDREVFDEAKGRLNINKTGAGLLSLTKISDHSGVTTISAGTLFLRDNATFTRSAVLVKTDATLGASEGNLHRGLTLENNARLAFELSDTDTVNLTLSQGIAAIGAETHLTLSLQTHVAPTDSFTLLSATTGSLDGLTFATVNHQAVEAGEQFSLSFDGVDYLFTLGYSSNAITATVVNPIPEPSTLFLLGAAGSIAFVLSRHRRRR